MPRQTKRKLLKSTQDAGARDRPEEGDLVVLVQGHSSMQIAYLEACVCERARARACTYKHVYRYACVCVVCVCMSTYMYIYDVIHTHTHTHCVGGQVHAEQARVLRARRDARGGLWHQNLQPGSQGLRYDASVTPVKRDLI